MTTDFDSYTETSGGARGGLLGAEPPPPQNLLEPPKIIFTV
jgi:hypothetical protein